MVCEDEKESQQFLYKSGGKKIKVREKKVYEDEREERKIENISKRIEI